MMSLQGDDIKARWYPCRSTTLKGSKREAIYIYGQGHKHHAIAIGSKENDGRIQTLSIRPFNAKGWTDSA